MESSNCNTENSIDSSGPQERDKCNVWGRFVDCEEILDLDDHQQQGWGSCENLVFSYFLLPPSCEGVSHPLTLRRKESEKFDERERERGGWEKERKEEATKQKTISFPTDGIRETTHRLHPSIRISNNHNRKDQFS